jgi:signal transduction histidine kinase
VQINFPIYLQSIFTHASQGELIQVLCNLIHNAIDASPPDSTIEVNLVTGPETLSIFVADQGEGIPPEDAPHIFEPFYTTKNKQAEGGMGLGLSISHSLVESMGGTLDFSTTIGHGSTFKITLPLTTTQ